jgi:hypothetical protein
MKKIIFAAVGFAAIFASSCKKNQDLVPIQKELAPGSLVDTLKGEITFNQTVTKTTYLLGIVYVKPNVTLTINPGVTIKGSPGPAIPDTVNLENNKGTLCIQRGAKLIANGTPNSPIVWTSSNAPGSRHFGDWGGLVVYGKAPIHRANGATNGLFEAFDYKPDERNRYGYGDAAFPTADPHDNSGSITYNRFEFGGGVVYVVDKEVNGVTLCGVGDNTVFHHNEILWSGDDAIEFFGGTVNVNHIVAFEAHDDNYDEDEGFSGNMQFVIGYQNTNCDNSGSHIIESDNDASATNATPHTNAFIANATFVGPTVAKNFSGAGNFYYDGAIFLRRNSRIKLVNSLVICQQQPWAVVVTPTTRPLVASVPNLSDSIVIAYNIFQTNSANPTVSSPIEGNPVPLATLNDAGLLAILSNSSNANSALATYGDFKLDGYLKPLAGSPALTGGVNLNALGLTQFVGTTQRGAVISSDPWTSTGTWISVANN